MLSYMSVERIEDDFVVCELEDIPTTDSKAEDFCEKPCFEVDIPKTMFTNRGFHVEEGMIFTVIHCEEKVYNICSIDEQERKRRIDIMEDLF